MADELYIQILLLQYKLSELPQGWHSAAEKAAVV